MCKEEDVASQTVSLDSIFIAEVIEASENQDVETIVLPDAFLDADLEDVDQMLMVIEGRLAELMATAEPKINQKFVAKVNNGEKMVHVKLQRAPCGLLTSILILYNKL